MTELTCIRLFLILATKLTEIPFLTALVESKETAVEESTTFSGDEDVDLCLYYLRTLSNVLTCTGDASWSALSSKHVSFREQQLQISCKSSPAHESRHTNWFSWGR